MSETFTGLPFGISKIREGISTWTNHEERRKILAVKPIVESASKNGKSKSSDSSGRDELKFESSITPGMHKGNRIKLEDSMTNKDKKKKGYSRNNRERRRCSST